jgi:hypothetical protein
MIGDVLRHFQLAAVLEVGSDAGGRAETWIESSSRDSKNKR